MATSTELWDALGPEYAGDLQPVKDLFLELAAGQMAPAAWGSYYALAAVYLALHMRALSERGALGTGGAGGPVTSEKAGDLQVNYGAVVGVLSRDALTATTRFGVEYLRLRRMANLTPHVVTD